MSIRKEVILNALASVSGYTILQPGSEDYEKSNNSYLSTFENELKPSFIARPSNVQHVQDLVRVLSPHTTSGDIQVALRGGGHTPFAGSADINDGATIDLRNLKVVVLDDDISIVTIGAGENWTTVYQELEKHGLTVPVGRVGGIGVSGFLLGGFACDSVIEFEVVLSSGDVVRANATVYHDLWVALKGGLNNFGIVTSFKMNTMKSGNIWGGVTYYMPGTFNELLLRDCDFVHTGADSDTHIMCSAGYGQEALAKIKNAEGFIFSFGTHPLTKTLLENSEKAGGNAMVIPPSDGPLFVILINPIWNLKEDDGRIFETVGALVDELRSIATERGLLHRYIFTDYGFKEDDVISGYGEESTSKLREVSRKYDPKVMFQKGVPGGFKLPQ